MEFSTVWVVYSQNKEVDISEFHFCFIIIIIVFLIHATRAGQKVTLLTHRVQFNARGLSSIIASVHRRNRVLTFSSLCVAFFFFFLLWPLFFYYYYYHCLFHSVSDPGLSQKRKTLRKVEKNVLAAAEQIYVAHCIC